MNPHVGALSLFDVANTLGVAADVSHVNTKAKVQVRMIACVLALSARALREGWEGMAARGMLSLRVKDRLAHNLPTTQNPRDTQGFEGNDQLGEALKGCDLVIIPAGVPRKPGMTRDDLFKVRAVLRFVRV
jgi:malate/lactate dehydrogenase